MDNAFAFTNENASAPEQKTLRRKHVHVPEVHHGLAFGNVTGVQVITLNSVEALMANGSSSQSRSPWN